jgi:hypothetical protein
MEELTRVSVSCKDTNAPNGAPYAGLAGTDYDQVTGTSRRRILFACLCFSQIPDLANLPRMPSVQRYVVGGIGQSHQNGFKPDISGQVSCGPLRAGPPWIRKPGSKWVIGPGDRGRVLRMIELVPSKCRGLIPIWIETLAAATDPGVHARS